MNTTVAAKRKEPSVRRPVSVRALTVVAACVLAVGMLASARVSAVPLGPEFRINTTTADSQATSRGSTRARAVAAYSGGYVIVWHSPALGLGIFGQRYDALGNPLGSEFVINSTWAGDQSLGSVDMDSNGNFVVVWEGNGNGDPDGVFARRFDAAGTAQGSEFLVNETTAGVQGDTDVTLDNNGDFIVVWRGNGPGDTDGVFVRTFDAGGSPTSGEQLVNTDTLGVQSRPAVAVDSNGDHVVAWDGPAAGGDLDVFFQRFSGGGSPQGPQVLVHMATDEDQWNAAISRANNGDFVVAWESDDDPTATAEFNIYARRFNTDGSPLGSESRINGTTAEAQIEPAVYVDSSRDFVVSWTSDDDVTAAIDWNVRLQQFDKDGNAIAGELLIPTTTAGPQRAPSVALNDIDNFMVVWHGNGEGDEAGVFGRLFTITPSADVGVSMTVSNAIPEVGQQINFFVTLVNNGSASATGVRVIDVLPNGLTYVAHVASQGNYDNVLGVWDVASMAVASSDVLRISAQVELGTQGQTLSNTATITAVDQIDPIASNDSVSVDVFPWLGTTSVAAEPQSSASLLPGGAETAVFRMRLRNNAAAPETLRAISLANTAVGSGSQMELDASWSMLTLQLDGAASALSSASFAAGVLTFAGLDVAIPPSDSVTLEIRGAASITARDGDVLDLRVDGPADFVLNGATTVDAEWPLDPIGTFVVDGMSSAQILVHEVASGNVFAGSMRNLAFDFTLPPNGYEADVLQKLNIINFGTALDQIDVGALDAWVDDGDGVFDPQRDRSLGGLVHTGNRWELTALTEPVPVSGVRIFVSVDLNPGATVGRTIRLGLADDTDVAVGMASSNDGPLDAPVSNRFELSVSTSDRVTLNAAILPSGPIRPGSREVALAQVVATNSYTTNKRLVSLTLTNTTVSANGGDPSQLDAELELLSLHLDGDGDGAFDPGVDPVIATTFFSQGRASFDAFAWDLPSGATQHLFVSGSVSLEQAADGDVLAAHIVDPFDVIFDDPTAIIASWPLDSGARWSVDGMIAAQVVNHGAAGVTLGPGDGPVLALDVTLPANGYTSDVLRGVALRNDGSGSGLDIADLRLWRDGGDGVFTPGAGDDNEIGPLVLVGASWKSPLLDENLGTSGLRLFVGVTVAAALSDSTSLELAIPIGGVQMLSGNDGPLDVGITNPEPLLLSSAPLLATLSVLPHRSTVGQNIDVSMTVRNFGAETVRAIAPSSLAPAGDASVVLVSGPTPATFDLMPAATSTFRWTYQATGIGSLRFSANTTGTGDVTLLPRRSLHAISNDHEVLLPADSLLVQPVGTMPFSVIRGETNVVPVSLTLTNAGPPTSADIALTELRLRVENDAGTGLIPADVLSRIALREGITTYVETTTLPSAGSEVLLTLTTPIVVTPSEPVTVSLLCDVAPATQEPAFRIVLMQSSWLAAEDVVSGQAVNVGLRQGAFPLRSGTGEIRAAPTELQVESNPVAAARVGYGQTDVLLLDLRLRNPGVLNLTSDVALSALEFSVLDANDQPLADPSRFFERVRIKSGAQIFEEHNVVSSQSETLRLTLTLPMIVPVNAATQLTILGDVAQGAPLGDVHLRLGDPSVLVARDISTNVAVPVVYPSAPLAGGTITLEAPATSLRAQGTSTLPASLSVGSSAVVALVAELRHPGSIGVGRVRVQSLRISSRDEARRSLQTSLYVDQFRLLRGAQELVAVTQIPATGDLEVAIPDLVLEPGETASVALEVDLEATAPNTFFEVVVSMLTAVDENLLSAVQVTPENGTELPLVSGLAQLESPATELVVGLESRIPAVLVGDGSRVPIARISLTNAAAGNSGSIQVDRLVLRGADRNAVETGVGAAASRAVAFLGGTLWATSDSLTADSLTVALQPAQPLFVAAGATAVLNVFATLQPTTSVDGFRMGVQSQDIVIRQPSNSLLTVRVQSESGATFPLWTEAGSFTAASLRESFTNFPNPFSAGREDTRFAFFLAEEAWVSLRLLTPRGELVSTLLPGSRHAAGMHQAQVWRGRNDRNRVVTNGVYVAELVVVYDGGRQERVHRKVAVVR